MLFLSDGLDLAYQDVGKGPALVLLHGWGANGAQWHDFGWDAVLPGRRLLIPDVRGHGQSAKPHDVESYRIERLAADVTALLDTAGAEEADLLGYSMGAAIALRVAYLEPGCVRSLVMGGVPAPDVEEQLNLGRALRGAAPTSERAEAYRAFADRFEGNDLPALAACLEAGLSTPPCGELAVYGGEALIAAGTRDRRFAASRDLSGCLPGGRFLALEDVDHMGAFGDRRFKEAVAEFLAEVSPA